MPIAALLDQVASYGASHLIEPVKKNNARLRIVTGNLIKVLQAQFQSEQAYLTTLANALQGDVLPLDVAFTPPSITTEMRSMKGFGNSAVNYAGWSTFGNMSCSFNNFIGADTFKFFYLWASVAGGLNFTVNQQGITPMLTTSPLSIPDTDGGSNSAYRVNASISQYYTNSTSAGDETEYTRWVIQSLWPTVVSTDGFNLEDMGTMIKTTVEFAADFCLPTTTTNTPSSPQSNAVIVGPLTQA